MWAGSTNGLSATDRVFTDDNSADIDNSTPDSALHRNVDLVVLKADEEGWFHLCYIRAIIIMTIFKPSGYVNTHIVMPSTIWGVASNPIVDAGITNRFSIQVPAMIKAALGRSQAGVVGKGKGLWTAVNVNERAYALSAPLLPIC